MLVLPKVARVRLRIVPLRVFTRMPTRECKSIGRITDITVRGMETTGIT